MFTNITNITNQSFI